MFTGIVEEIGVVRSARRTGDLARLEIEAEITLEGTRVGDSIALNGACQTVVSIDRSLFIVEALAETLRKTTLGAMKPGDRVHLERALSLSGRLGGHLVQGHVNGVARVRELRREGENVYLVLSLPPELERYCVLEGSVAVDGVSLTICALDPGTIEVNLIPHTRGVTLLGEKAIGGEVNIETDVIAKYAQRLLSFGISGRSGGGRGPSRLETLLESAF